MVLVMTSHCLTRRTNVTFQSFCNTNKWFIVEGTHDHNKDKKQTTLQSNQPTNTNPQKNLDLNARRIHKTLINELVICCSFMFYFLNKLIRFILRIKVWFSSFVTVLSCQVVLVVKNPPGNVGDIRDTGRSLGQEDPLGEGMASH